MSELPVRGGIEDNSKIIFLISQRKMRSHNIAFYGEGKLFLNYLGYLLSGALECDCLSHCMTDG